MIGDVIVGAVIGIVAFYIGRLFERKRLNDDAAKERALWGQLATEAVRTVCTAEIEKG